MAIGTGDTEAAARRVAKNVRRIRRAKGSMAWLATKMTELGYPIHESQISRIETGQRRVGPDDLLALSAALNVNVSTLLMPEDEAESVHLTGNVHVARERAWMWLDGMGALPTSDSGGQSDRAEAQSRQEFQFHARPLGLRNYQRPDPCEGPPQPVHVHFERKAPDGTKWVYGVVCDDPEGCSS